jgi:hypothetical protein
MGKNEIHSTLFREHCVDEDAILQVVMAQQDDLSIASGFAVLPIRPISKQVDSDRFRSFDK